MGLRAAALLPLLTLALWASQGISPSYLLGHPAVPLHSRNCSSSSMGNARNCASRGHDLARWFQARPQRFLCTYSPNRTHPRGEQDLCVGLSPVGDVDVVYLWVNGSDPVHRASLEQWSGAHLEGGVPGRNGTRAQLSSPPTAAGAASNRFDSDRDELRFSIRSVVRHMPWFRHLYIVTSGQVPSWLNVSHPRVTVVPHSSIFERPEDLPTFNSHAIEANIHRIPGLSDNFIALNDDFFLTKPWSLDDFVTRDGGEVFYEAWVAPTCRYADRNCGKASSVFAESLRHVDRLLLKYSNRTRYVPSHSMYFIQKAWMQQLQSEFAEEYRSTSAHRFREGTDMQFAAAYKWYVAERQTACRNRKAADGRTDFVMITRKSWNGIKTRLKQSWKRTSKVKLVCLNDDITRETEQERALVNKLVTGFLSKQYPQPSEFELPAGTTNSCGHLKSSYGRLPAAEEVAAACSLDLGTDLDAALM